MQLYTNIKYAILYVKLNSFQHNLFFIFIFITTVGRVSIQSNSNSKPFVLNVCDTFIYLFFNWHQRRKKQHV